MRTTRIVFDQIEVKATVRWRDPETGKPRQQTKRFMQTYNPFNKRSDGQIKSREEIRTEVNRDAQLWKLRTENDIREGKYPGVWP